MVRTHGTLRPFSIRWRLYVFVEYILVPVNVCCSVASCVHLPLALTFSVLVLDNIQAGNIYQ